MPQLAMSFCAPASGRARLLQLALGRSRLPIGIVRPPPPPSPLLRGHISLGGVTVMQFVLGRRVVGPCLVQRGGVGEADPE